MRLKVFGYLITCFISATYLVGMQKQPNLQSSSASGFSYSQPSKVYKTNENGELTTHFLTLDDLIDPPRELVRLSQVAHAQFGKNQDLFKRYIGGGSIPHLLIHGPRGSGKSTLINAFAGTLKANIVYISAIDLIKLAINYSKKSDYALFIDLLFNYASDLSKKMNQYTIICFEEFDRILSSSLLHSYYKAIPEIAKKYEKNNPMILVIGIANKHICTKEIESFFRAGITKTEPSSEQKRRKLLEQLLSENKENLSEDSFINISKKTNSFTDIIMLAKKAYGLCKNGCLDDQDINISFSLVKDSPLIIQAERENFIHYFAKKNHISLTNETVKNIALSTQSLKSSELKDLILCINTDLSDQNRILSIFNNLLYTHFPSLIPLEPQRFTLLNNYINQKKHDLSTRFIITLNQKLQGFSYNLIKQLIDKAHDKAVKFHQHIHPQSMTQDIPINEKDILYALSSKKFRKTLEYEDRVNILKYYIPYQNLTFANDGLEECAQCCENLIKHELKGIVDYINYQVHNDKLENITKDQVIFWIEHFVTNTFNPDNEDGKTNKAIQEKIKNSLKYQSYRINAALKKFGKHIEAVARQSINDIDILLNLNEI